MLPVAPTLLPVCLFNVHSQEWLCHVLAAVFFILHPSHFILPFAPPLYPRSASLTADIKNHCLCHPRSVAKLGAYSQDRISPSRVLVVDDGP